MILAFVVGQFLIWMGFIFSIFVFFVGKKQKIKLSIKLLSIPMMLIGVVLCILSITILKN